MSLLENLGVKAAAKGTCDIKGIGAMAPYLPSLHHRNGSTILKKAFWITKIGHILDKQSFYTKETCNPLWMLSCHQAHTN